MTSQASELLTKLWGALLAVGFAASSSACKPRDPDAGGLLSSDEPAPASAEVAKGGDWLVSCQPAGDDVEATVYQIAVAGAVSESDESQDVLVSVEKSNKGQIQVVAENEAGHGALSPSGSVFVGFSSGVLTAELASGTARATHAGVLTLSKDQAASGLNVTCAVERQPVTGSQG